MTGSDAAQHEANQREANHHEANQMDVEFRSLGECDEASVMSARQELLDADDFEFAIGWDDSLTWQQYVASVDRIELGDTLGYGQVPASFRVALVDGAVVGRVSVRHRLSEELLFSYGHIGICVVPSARRIGVGRSLVEHGLEIARTVGASPILAVCDRPNLASAATLLASGGVEEVAPYIAPDAPVRRFWFDLA